MPPHPPCRRVVQNTALFPRLDSFLERCHDLLDLCKTVVQFQKLEKVEVGGNKGRTLSASVYQVRMMMPPPTRTALHTPRRPPTAPTHRAPHATHHAPRTSHHAPRTTHPFATHRHPSPPLPHHRPPRLTSPRRLPSQIYADFTSVLESFKKLPYDVLDVETKQFDDDFYDFRCQIKELERRLGSVLNQVMMPLPLPAPTSHGTPHARPPCPGLLSPARPLLSHLSPQPSSHFGPLCSTRASRTARPSSRRSS